MFASPDRQRVIVRFTWVMAIVATVVGELHALARHATADGKADLDLPLTRAWAVPAARALRPLLDWSDPDTVYVTYGKIWLPVFAAFTACAFVVRAHRHPHGFEKWAWRVALAGYVIATLSVLGDYWTPWLDQSFVALTIPGLLLTLIGSTSLGIVLLRRGFRPRVSAWLLVLVIPLVFGIAQVTSLGNAILPVLWAWAIAGRRITRELPAYPEPGRVVADVTAGVQRETTVDSGTIIGT
jgi:hypothetical protein